MKILLIEDSGDDADLIIETLNDCCSGCEIVVSTKLADGIGHARTTLFDMVLLDLNLPDSTGLDTFQSFYTLTRGIVPVIVLTGLSDDNTGQQAVASGAQDYVTKNGLIAGNVNLSHAILFAIARHHRLTSQLYQRQELTQMISDLRNLRTRQQDVIQQTEESIERLERIMRSLDQVNKF